MTDKPFGIDFYSGDGNMNLEIVKQSPVKFVAIRCGISWGYTDSRFHENWRKFNGAFPRTAYHVLYPGEDPTRQAEAQIKILGKDPGEFPPSLDVELDHGQSKYTITKAINKYAERIFKEYSYFPIMYSRATWIDAFTELGSWRNQYWWWIAHYGHMTEYVGAPWIPTGLDRSRLIIHQTTDYGKPIGCESKTMDYNRWQGTEESMNKFIDSIKNHTDYPTTKFNYQFKILVPYRNVRTGPGTNFKITGYYQYGDILEATELSTDQEWARTLSGEWVWILRGAKKLQ